MEVRTDTRYWVAHVRGANFEKLRERGFLTFYPTLDDYVCLKVSEENRKLLTKQTELGVFFLKQKGEYTTISTSEMLNWFTQTEAKIDVGADILVVAGYGSNLDGKVLEISEDNRRLYVELYGLTRTYPVWVDRLEVVAKELAEAA